TEPLEPVPMELPECPPTILGLMASGSNLSARWPKTFSSRGWLSVVPRKFTLGTVPELPRSFQNVPSRRAGHKSVEHTLPSAIAREVTEFGASAVTVIAPGLTVEATAALPAENAYVA